MQYCQMQYIIKILLLNGLFVLFAHAMEKNVLTNIDLTNNNVFDETPPILLPLNKSNYYLSELSDKPPVSANCPTVLTSQLLGITTSLLLNCNQTFEPFFYKENIKKRKKNQSEDQNSGRDKKKKRTNLTPQQKKKIRPEKNRLSAENSRERLKDAISAIVQETDVVGERETGLNNALVVIRELKRKSDLLEINNIWQIENRVILLQNYHKQTSNHYDRETMEAAKKILDGEYQAALHEVFERDKTIETLKSQIKTMKEELEESNEFNKNMNKYNSDLKKKMAILKTTLSESQVTLSESQVTNYKLQENYLRVFGIEFREQNSKLFPNSNHFS